MARPPAYKLYCGVLPTIHTSNDLQVLIERAKLHSEIFRKKYVVKDINGNVIWRDKNDD